MQLDHVSVGLTGYQFGINVDGSDIIDHHSDLDALRVFQQVFEGGSLSSSQESTENGHGYGRLVARFGLEGRDGRDGRLPTEERLQTLEGWTGVKGGSLASDAADGQVEEDHL